MASQAFLRNNFVSKNKHTFPINTVNLLIILNLVHSVRCQEAATYSEDQSTTEEYLSSTTTEDYVDRIEENKDADILEDYKNWLLVLPYLPVAVLILLCCACRGCGYKQLKAQTRPATVAAADATVQVDIPTEQPVYIVPTSPPDYYTCVDEQYVGPTLNYSPSIHWSSAADPVQDDLVISEAEPPAYDSLFEVKVVE